jgi:hypothetical protein
MDDPPQADIDPSRADRSLATAPIKPDPVPPRKSIKGALASLGGGTARLIGKGREEINETLRNAGASVERLHRRLALIMLVLFAVLLLGAGFRAMGWAEGNYLLIGLVAAAALYAVISPVHLIGVLLVSGGVAAWKGRQDAQAGLMAYARLLGLVLLACLTPLVLFAVAPGDTSFWLSLRLLLLTPVVVLALWLFGQVSPRAERFVFIAAPLIAVTLALGNMLVPERTLAAMGVPAWLRAPRPQDEELARLETAIEKRRNEARAVRLREIRAKIEHGTPLTAGDEAAVAEAQRDRVTFPGWVGARTDAVLADIRRRTADSGKVTRPALVLPAAGTLIAPAGAWSGPIAVPRNTRLCTASEGGEAAYTTQCASDDGGWTRRSAGGCEAGAFDRSRFLGRSRARTISYRFTALTSTCEEG